MNGVGHPQHNFLIKGITVSIVLASCLIVGCESEPAPSGLSDWLDTTQQHESANKAKTDDDLEKPVPSGTGPHPKAVIPESDFDFGQMRVGTHMRHDFKIINEGEAPLRLVAGTPTCKCTQFSVTPAEVPPGESATLVVEWHGKSETTSFQHGGKVYTNDPTHGSIRFNVGGTVDATVVTQPEGLWNAGDIPGKDPISFEGTLVSRFLPELTITDMVNESEFVTAEVLPMNESQLTSVEAQSGWKIRVTVQPGFPVGQLKDTLRIAVAEVEEPLEIPVVAQRLGDIRLVPMKGTNLNSNTRTLHLGQFPAARGRTAEFMLMVDRKVFADEFEILEVDSSPKSLTATLEPIGKPNSVVARYKMTVGIPPGGLRMERRKDNPATIRLLTNHPTEQEILLKLIYNTF